MNNSETYKELGTISFLFKWMEKHPVVANIIIWIEILIGLYVVFTYNFTTNI